MNSLANYMLCSTIIGLTLRLFQSDTRPLEEKDKASRYKEADFDGYVPIFLKLKDWNIQGTEASTTQCFIADREQVPQKVYGYYLTDKVGALVYAERFDDAPDTFQLEDDELEIRLAIGV